MTDNQRTAMSTHSLPRNLVLRNDNNVEMVMSTVFRIPAAGGRIRSRGSVLVGTMKNWWIAYLTRRIERVAIVHLETLSDRELEDIGLTRSQIEWAARGERRSSAQTKFEPIVELQPGRGDELAWPSVKWPFHFNTGSLRQRRF